MLTKMGRSILVFVFGWIYHVAASQRTKNIYVSTGWCALSLCTRLSPTLTTFIYFQESVKTIFENERKNYYQTQSEIFIDQCVAGVGGTE